MCPTLCDPMDCSTPGIPVLHYLLEFSQTDIHWVGDDLTISSYVTPSPHCLGPSLFFFLAFLGDGMSLWSSWAWRSFGPVIFLYGCWGGGWCSATLGITWERTDGSSKAIFLLIFLIKGKDKKEKFDSIASFFWCSQHPVQAHIRRQLCIA